MRRRDVLAAGLAGLLILPIVPAWAQQYPTRAIHVIVPSSPGGIHDVIARTWAGRVAADLGTSIIENRGGGNALIALSAVTNAAPDGHTLLLGSTSTIVLRMLEDPKSYAAAAALEPATIFSASSTSIAVNPRLPVNTMKEFIAYVKERPGKFTFGSGGTGAITHVAGELFSQRAGLAMLHVPYKGIAPAMNDFLGNRLDALFPNVTASILQMHANGDIRLLAINAPERIDAAPGIPTAIEAGLPDFIAQLTFGLYAPAKTPMRILERVARATHAGWADKHFQKKMVQAGFEPVLGAGPDKSRQMIADEYARWKPVIAAVRAHDSGK